MVGKYGINYTPLDFNFVKKTLITHPCYWINQDNQTRKTKVDCFIKF